jgi:hypothetical protein
MNEIAPLFPLAKAGTDLQELYAAVCKQIRKDFHPHVEMAFPEGSLSAEWLLAEIRRMLGEILQQGGSNLGTVIYRVDLKESTTRAAMNNSSTDNRLAELSMLILRREAQKVWLRKHLSP